MTRAAIAIAASGALALFAVSAHGEVVLPEGAGNSVGTSCSDAETVTVVSDDKSWPLEDGGQVVAETKDGDDWKLACTMSNGSMSVGTACFSDGYVVAGRAGEDLKIACYEGEIPAGLK